MVRIKQNIKEAFVDNKYLFLFSTILFILTLFLGYFLHYYLQDFFNPVVNQFSNEVKKGVISFSFQSIFLNNILIVLRLFIFGIVFGISSAILAFNGFFLGYFIANYGDLFKVLILIIPHGIFELPSIIIANTAGLVLFKYLFKVITLKNSEPNEEEIIVNNDYFNRFYRSLLNNGNYLKQALILLAISSILMIIAGIIEVYFTKNIANFFINLVSLK